MPSAPLSETDKDAIILEQAALIEHLAGRIKALEALFGKPLKTSMNSSAPPSSDGLFKGDKSKRSAKTQPPWIGSGRKLTAKPDRTEVAAATACGQCGGDVSDRCQSMRARYDHIDLPPISPIVTRIELMGGLCWCGCRFRAKEPAAMPLGSPFGPGIRMNRSGFAAGQLV